MAHADKVKSDAKHVEGELRATGEHEHANRIQRLRRGYSAAIATLKTLHADNMRLREKLENIRSDKVLDDLARLGQEYDKEKTDGLR